MLDKCSSQNLYSFSDITQLYFVLKVLAIMKLVNFFCPVMYVLSDLRIGQINYCVSKQTLEET